MEAVNHKERAHALLSASGSARWLNCPPSARMEDEFPEGESSTAAQEGTLAHEFGDLGLQLFKGSITFEQWQYATAQLRQHRLYTDEMEGHVDTYVDYVREAYNLANKQGDAELSVEEKIDLTTWIPESFGTGDAAVVGSQDEEGVDLEVIDLKYGKGVKVFAFENEQLGLYGGGILDNVEMLREIRNVKLTIVQPRLDHIDSYIISADRLRDWLNGDVTTKAKLAFEGKGECRTGKWCKWCKAKAICSKMAADNLALAKHEFKEPRLLDRDQVLEAYHKVDQLVDWANSLKSYMLAEALNGEEWEGLKVVEGGSRRAWTDPEKVLEIMKKSKVKQADYTKVSLLGIPALEKVLKGAFTKKLGDYVKKPPGAPNLVPVEDRRPPMVIKTAAQEFNDDEELNIL